MRICDSQLFLSCRGSGLAGADPNSLFEVSNEYLSIADPARPGDVGDRFQDRLDDAVIHSNLDLGPVPELRFIHFSDSDTLYAQLRDRFPELIQLEGPDYSRDHFHEMHFEVNRP